MKFIHAADLHLDSPLQGLSRYENAPVERLRNATRSAFTALIKFSISEQIDFMLLAGDIFDGDWRDFHTGLFFRDQLGQLRDAGIPVFIIHGNHDAQSIISKTLPTVEGVTIFSADVCETTRLDTLGVALHGQSFATREVKDDLAKNYPVAVPGLFNIGLLHTSLSGREGHGNYAPTSLHTLCEKGYDYFALGHVHTREVIRESDPRIVFPGNLQGRHAKETGAKGCEMVCVENGTIISTQFVEFDVVRWHQLTIDATSVISLDDLAREFISGIGKLIQQVDQRLHAVRVHIVGESALYQQEAKHPGTVLAAIQAATQDITEHDVWLEKIYLSLKAPLKRDVIAEVDDALGEVVRLVNELLSDDDALLSWFNHELRGMKPLPPAMSEDDPALFSIEQIKDHLFAAESTVLANLTGELHRDTST